MVYLKRSIRVIAFIVGLVFLLFVTSQIFVPKLNTEASGLEEGDANGFIAEADNSIDVLMVGDSILYSSINPMQIWGEAGYTVYNCGSSAQELSYTLTLLHRFFEHQSPKIVFLETSAIFRVQNNNTIASNLLGEIFPVFQYHDRWKDLDIEDFYSPIAPDVIVYDKGYMYSERVEASVESDVQEYVKELDLKDRISTKNRIFVEIIKAYVESQGAQFVLVSVPSLVSWNYHRHEEVMKLADSLNCQFIDMNLLTNAVPIDWSGDSRDGGDHLNYAGAIKVTNFIIEYLRRSGLVESHRYDYRYHSWEESYEYFLMEIA